MMRTVTLALFFFSIFLQASFSAVLLPDEKNNVEVYQRCAPAVVNITATTLRQDFFFEIVPQKGMGSGAIIRSEGYIVTNGHVVGEASKVEVTFNDKTSLPARVVGIDPDSDLAVLKVEMKGRKFPVLELGNRHALAVGQKALAIGNPFGLGGSLSMGIISSLGRDIRTPSDRLLKDIIQTDAAINPGNSGGPLLDSSGKLIGINAQIVSNSGGSEGIGFAISSDTVQKVVDQLIQFGKVLRPEFGINGVGLSGGLMQAFELPGDHGVMITELDPNGLAQKAGLRPAEKEVVLGFRRFPYGGDVIYQIDSTPVMTMRDVLDYFSEKKTGETITVHFYRGKTKKTATMRVTLPVPAGAKSL